MGQYNRLDVREQTCTVLSRIVPGKPPWALAAQVQKLRVGSYTEEEVLEWFCTSAHPRCKVSVCIVASPMLHRGQSDGGESCIVLESGPTRSLVAKLPQCSSLVIRELHVRDACKELCEQGYRRVCVKL